MLSQGAEAFGWSERNATPRSTRRGTALVGHGMAGGVWESPQMPAAAKASLAPDGTLTVSSGTSDIEPGTYTALAILASETLGLHLSELLLGSPTLNSRRRRSRVGRGPSRPWALR